MSVWSRLQARVQYRRDLFRARMEMRKILDMFTPEEDPIMLRHGISSVPTDPTPSEGILSSIYALYHREIFLGSCFAITPEIVVSAGHHYNTVKDDVGDLSVLVEGTKWIRCEYAAKNSKYDVLVLWLVEPVPSFASLRGYFPQERSLVSTVWLSLKPPHQHVISPGVILESSVEKCLVKGTVSTLGSSGAPLVDFHGSCVVGIHLTSNTKDGSRVSECLNARKLVSILAEMGISCRV